MTIQKSQAVANLNHAFNDTVPRIISIIDGRLKNVFDGDPVTISLDDLDLSPINSHALYHKVLHHIIETYKKAGWEVVYDDGRDGSRSQLWFK